ncbi:glycoside hydrolase family 76 protein [Solicola gregarius]|uniref:Glycoside hydrolase family 76 protein n=1 Tax=Solicola gregarius TaxID=2908642 RepID=A0AA46YIY9_9ACTN|nr:glycoside hydrolase family 76 protein [Solicola gregarius]UYM03582.1 glycoside hydrolase family 76 protein [Solicola gregarius]
MSKRWIRAGAAALAATMVVSLSPAGAASLAPAPDSDRGRSMPRERASGAVDAMMRMYDAKSGRWDPDAAWWQSGNALIALLDYVRATGDREHLWALDNTVEEQRKPLPWWPEGGGEFRADSTDDTGWWGLAMVRAYDLTRRTKYLDIAKIDEEYIYRYWDDVCGGGVWWDIPDPSYKNAISIELYIKLAASLHNRIPRDKAYLRRAIEAWEWFRDSGMINDAGLVNDGLDTQSGSCASNHGTTWTYNQGVVLGGLAELYKATHDRTYLRSARRIADAVIASDELSPDGHLTEPCEHAGTCNEDQAAFKGIFARNLAELERALPGDRYGPYLRTQARTAFRLARNGADEYGLSWTGPFDKATIARQESAVSLLVAALPRR